MIFNASPDNSRNPLVTEGETQKCNTCYFWEYFLAINALLKWLPDSHKTHGWTLSGSFHVCGKV